MCAPGMYCMTSEINPNDATCQPILEVGATCLNDDQCGYGGVCLFTQ